MSKLPVVSGREALKAFQKMGYALDRQKGSHLILRHQAPPYRRLTIPITPSLPRGHYEV